MQNDTKIKKHDRKRERKYCLRNKQRKKVRKRRKEARQVETKEDR